MVAVIGAALPKRQPDVAVPRTKRAAENRDQAAAGGLFDMHESVHQLAPSFISPSGVSVSGHVIVCYCSRSGADADTSDGTAC
jgi:hypothetical protein